MVGKAVFDDSKDVSVRVPIAWSREPKKKIPKAIAEVSSPTKIVAMALRRDQSSLISDYQLPAKRLSCPRSACPAREAPVFPLMLPPNPFGPFSHAPKDKNPKETRLAELRFCVSFPTKPPEHQERTQPPPAENSQGRPW